MITENSFPSVTVCLSHFTTRSLFQHVMGKFHRVRTHVVFQCCLLVFPHEMQNFLSLPFQCQRTWARGPTRAPRAQTEGGDDENRWSTHKHTRTHTHAHTHTLTHTHTHRVPRKPASNSPWASTCLSHTHTCTHTHTHTHTHTLIPFLLLQGRVGRRRSSGSWRSCSRSWSSETRSSRCWRKTARSESRSNRLHGNCSCYDVSVQHGLRTRRVFDMSWEVEKWNDWNLRLTIAFLVNE